MIGEKKTELVFQTISFATYLKNCTNYSFERFILSNQWGVKKNNIIDSQIALQNNYSDKNFECIYIQINTNFLIENKFWDPNQNVEFLFDLIEILDCSDDRYEMFKKLFFSSGTFVLKFRYCLRNIGTHPLNDKIIQKLVVSTCQDLNLAALFYPTSHFHGL